MSGKPKQAIHTPTSFPSAKEIHTDDLEVGQYDAVNLDKERTSDIVLPVDGEQLDTDQYLRSMKFYEEPMTISIHRSADKFPAPVVDLWVDGKGAEQFVNGKWMICGWLPVGVPCITKRKFVEVLARAKTDSVQTRVVKHENHEDNLADRTTSTKYPFSVIQDSNPMGHQWLSKVLMEG